MKKCYICTKEFKGDIWYLYFDDLEKEICEKCRPQLRNILKNPKILKKLLKDNVKKKDNEGTAKF